MYEKKVRFYKMINGDVYKGDAFISDGDVVLESLEVNDEPVEDFGTIIDVDILFALMNAAEKESC